MFDFNGAWLLVVTGGEPTADKPDITFAAPPDPSRVSHSITIRVPDCQGACALLKERLAPNFHLNRATRLKHTPSIGAHY